MNNIIAKNALYHALKFASLDISVFPLTPGTKLPIQGFPWKQKSSTCSFTLHKWAKQYPGCNFAVDCGKSNLVVLDVDVKKGKKGAENLALLELLEGEVPKVYSVETPTGGFHHYMKGRVANSVEKLAGGLDIRSVGGYVVGPGSVVDGKVYTELTPEAKSLQNIPNVPEWLKKEAGKKKEKTETKVEKVDPGIIDLEHNVKRAIKLVRLADPAIAGQGADIATYEMAQKVRDLAISETKCFEILAEHFNPRCLPPRSIDPEDEHSFSLMSKVKNAYTYAEKTIGNETPEFDFKEIDAQETTEEKKESEGGLDWSKVVKPFGDFTKYKFPPVEHYLAPWMNSRTISMIYGPPGCGKSWFAISVLMAIAKGRAFGPWDFKKSCKTLYFDAEMIGSDVQERLEKLNDESDFINPPYIYSNDFAELSGFPKADLYDAKWREGMKTMLLELEIKVWVLDNISSASTRGDENSKEDWNPINQWLMSLRFAGISTIVLHHTNKSGGQRGTSAREDNINVNIELRKPKGHIVTDGAKFDVIFKKARISTKDQHSLHGYRFELILEGEKAFWSCKKPGRDRKEAVLVLNKEGFNIKEIADQLECTPQNVGKILRESRGGSKSKRAIRDFETVNDPLRLEKTLKKLLTE